MIPIILASGSPRRKELLAQTGLAFEIIVSDIDEIADENLTAEALVADLALQKAQAIARQQPNKLVIGADTLVFLGNQRFGKPTDEHDAQRMLQLLSNTTHSVYTGVALIYNELVLTFVQRADIRFAPLSETFITEYIRSGSPLDKAGSYGIQDLPSDIVTIVSGDFNTVMGFPNDQFMEHYNQFLQLIKKQES